MCATVPYFENSRQFYKINILPSFRKFAPILEQKHPMSPILRSKQYWQSILEAHTSQAELTWWRIRLHRRHGRCGSTESPSDVGWLPSHLPVEQWKLTFIYKKKCQRPRALLQITVTQKSSRLWILHQRQIAYKMLTARMYNTVENYCTYVVYSILDAK